MGKTKRKLHLGVTPIGGPTVKSRRLARRITSQYHQLRTAKAEVLATEALNSLEKDEKLQEIEKKLEVIGGTHRYQEASIISTKHFKSSKWIIQAIRRLRVDIIKSNGQPLKTLEVGAINTQLHDYKAELNVKSIDINSQHPLIEEIDFFDVIPDASYNVVVCSMVMNCVFEECKRGEMLARLRAQLTTNGILFLVLPKRCLELTPDDRSRTDIFISICQILHLKLIEEHNTPRLIFFVFEKDTHAADTDNTMNANSSNDRWIEITKTICKPQYKTLQPLVEQFVSPGAFNVRFADELIKPNDNNINKNKNKSNKAKNK